MDLLSKLFGSKRKPAMGEPAANDAVRAQLAKFGDDGAAVRHVAHYAYPADGADLSIRDEMISDLTARGFAVSDAAAKQGLVLDQHRAAAPDDFDALTTDLSAWFAARRWAYDGWECAVVAPTRHSRREASRKRRHPPKQKGRPL